jgi:hypothetical protein
MFESRTTLMEDSPMATTKPKLAAQAASPSTATPTKKTVMTKTELKEVLRELLAREDNSNLFRDVARAHALSDKLEHALSSGLYLFARHGFQYPVHLHGNQSSGTLSRRRSHPNHVRCQYTY